MPRPRCRGYDGPRREVGVHAHEVPDHGLLAVLPVDEDLLEGALRRCSQLVRHGDSEPIPPGGRMGARRERSILLSLQLLTLQSPFGALGLFGMHFPWQSAQALSVTTSYSRPLAASGIPAGDSFAVRTPGTPCSARNLTDRNSARVPQTPASHSTSPDCTAKPVVTCLPRIDPFPASLPGGTPY